MTDGLGLTGPTASGARWFFSFQNRLVSLVHLVPPDTRETRETRETSGFRNANYLARPGRQHMPIFFRKPALSAVNLKNLAAREAWSEEPKVHG